ncbi:pilus assembly protein PilY [Corallococcus terminator]
MLRFCRPLIAALAFAIPLAALAQDGGTVSYNPCIDTTGADKQPPFAVDAGVSSAIILTPDGKLRLNTNRSVLDPERIILPFDQELEALIVHDQAGGGASNTLGWFYYDDLVTGKYIDVKDVDNPNDDVLLDNDNNGVPDFHEDLYNLNPDRYIGPGPRCGANAKTFLHTRPDNTVVRLREPDLLTGPCNAASSYDATSGPRRWPDEYGPLPSGAVVGRRVRDHATGMLDRDSDMLAGTPAATLVDSLFSDRGLFPHIPNLLEPRASENENRGIGKLIYLATDDDDNHCPDSAGAGASPTSECFQPRMAYSEVNGVRTPVGTVWDKSTGNGNDGLPDYKASAFDNQGLLIPGKNPQAAPNEEDRRQRMGRIVGGREIVFFLVTYVEQIYGNATDTCFMTRTVTLPDNSTRLQCNLWGHGDINVFFTKTLLNLDLHQTDGNVVTTKELQNEWLEAGAYTRLRTATYGDVRFNRPQTQTVYSYFQRAAHTLVGAPVDNPRVWILGWEDQNSGGNRTYDDTVILINKQNNGTFKSDIVSSISLDVAQDYTITSVEMRIEDTPYHNVNGQQSDCSPNINLPKPDGSGTYQPRPQITYQVSLDCKVCVDRCETTNPDFQPNPSPAWVTVPFSDARVPSGSRDETRTVNDFLERGYTGSQLCWRAIFESPGESCQPTIANVNISYKAQKAGQYGRASVLPVANTIIFGLSETPGRTWYKPDPWYESSPSPANRLYPSYRVYDERLDVSERGHVYLRRLYEPDDPSTPNDAADNWDQWNAGDQLNDFIRSTNPKERKLFTTQPGGSSRVTLESLSDEGTNTSPLFPTPAGSVTDETKNFCVDALAGRYDLNRDGACNQFDRNTLRNWVYGWEDNKLNNPAAGSGTRRTWPMGGINLSTAAIVGPASEPTWVKRATTNEQQAFRGNAFIGNNTLKNRDAVAFIGSTTGYLHALSLGELRSGDDTCTGFKDFRGYFAHAAGCSSARKYGTGEELYAYLPGKLLRFFAENYVRGQDKTKRATVDASPAVAAVDLRSDAEYTADKGHNPSVGDMWQLSTSPSLRTDAKTVLVSPTGPRQSVFFALDVTRPAATDAGYPGVLWELDVQRDRFSTSSGLPCSTPANCLTLEELFRDYSPDRTLRPDTGGSRHNPLLVRMDFGTKGGKKWVAAFASDYTPRSHEGQAARATLYLVDVKTGLPIQVNQTGGTTQKKRLAGVVVMGDAGEGIGSPPVAIDADNDSNYDVVYVATTKGRVFRINLRDVDASRELGKAVSACVIADARNDLDPATGSKVRNANMQSIYSNIAVTQERTGTGTSVRIFVGTGNNPEDDNEVADRDPRPRYHVMAFNDPTPLSANCAGRSVAWVQELGERQVVWGGVTVDDEGTVHTATAVGTSANLCSLDANESGRMYAFNAAQGTPTADNDKTLEGHGLTQPVAFDKRVFFQGTNGITSTGAGKQFNNETGNGTGSTSRTIIWDVRPGGNIQGLIP